MVYSYLAMAATPKVKPELPQTPITVAVAPLKAAGMDRAEKFARMRVEMLEAELASHDNDRDAYAPYPSSRTGAGKTYQSALNRYRFVHALTSVDRERTKTYRLKGDPTYATIDPEKVAKFVAEVREVAAGHYEVYVWKLNKKIGEVTEATLTAPGDLWEESYLHVVTASGEVQNWKTQIITNVSSLGNPYNQWPTRKMKTAAGVA